MMSEEEKRELIMGLPDWSTFAEMESELSRPNGIIIPDFKVGFDKVFESGGVSFDMPDSEIRVEEIIPDTPKRIHIEHGNIDSNDTNFKPLF